MVDDNSNNKDNKATYKHSAAHISHPIGIGSDIALFVFLILQMKKWRVK